RDYLRGEQTLFHRTGGAALAFQCQLVLGLARDAVAAGHVLGSDTHVHALPRVVQDAVHVVQGSTITQATAPAHGWKDIGTAAHAFGAATDGHFRVTEHDGLGGGDDGLQAGATEAVDVERRGFLGNARVHGSDTAEVGVTGLGGNDVAHDHMPYLLGSHTGALQGSIYRRGSQRCQRRILEGTSEGSYC